MFGCGGDDEPSAAEPPTDFAITVKHVDGSVPPPHHVEWTLTVADDGAATVTYVPDYSGPGVPRYRERFTAGPAALDALYAALEREDLLREDREESSDPPIGGGVDIATVTLDGRRIDIPAFGADGAPSLTPVMDEITAIVPRRIWRSFERRREAHALRRYGERPGGS